MRTRGLFPLVAAVGVVIAAAFACPATAQLKPAALPEPKDWKPGAEATAGASGSAALTREFVWGEKLEPVSGSFKLSAVDNTWGEDPASKDILNDCVAQVRVPSEKAVYGIRLTKLRPVGIHRPTMGGVMVNGDLFGNSELGGPGLFPRLHAYVAVWGLAAVARNGKIVAKDRPALAWVGQAGRDRNGKWLYAPDAQRVTAHLIVFGSLGGPGPLPGTRDGFLHVSWEGAQVTVPGFSSVVRSAPQAAAASVGKQP